MKRVPEAPNSNKTYSSKSASRTDFMGLVFLFEQAERVDEQIDSQCDHHGMDEQLHRAELGD